MNKWIVAATVVLPTLIEIIDISVVNVSLGHIRGSLSAGLDEATWTITAYLVSNAIIIPLTGWLSRVFGRKRYLMFSVALFTVSSFLCGASQTLASLVFFRILQGIGGGALQPISHSILLETFPREQQGLAGAIFGIGVMFGPIVGPILGGWITDNWSWHWIFYINVPIGIFSLFLIQLVIQDPPYLKRIRAKIDYWGLIFIAVGLGCLQVILDKGQREDWFSSALIVRLTVISAIALVAFIVVELRSKEPVVNLRVFKNISFASGNIIQFLAFFVLFGSIVLIPLFLQELMGYNAFLAGLALAPGGLVTLFTMPTAAFLVTKISPKTIMVCGILVTAVSTFMMTSINLYVNFDMIMWARNVMGLGMGLIFIPLFTTAFSTIKKEDMGNATSVFNLLRNLGGSFGVAFVTTMLSVRAQHHQFRFSEHLTPFDPRYQLGVQKAMGIIAQQTGQASPQAAQGLIYLQLIKQATLFAFVDAFHICTLIMLCILPLVFLLKRPKYVDPSSVTLH